MAFMPLFLAPTMSWLRSPIIMGLGGIDGGLVERVSQQIALIDAGAVQFGAEHALEMRLQAKMVDDAIGEDAGLLVATNMPMAGLAERGEDVADAVVNGIFKETDVGNRSR